MNKKSLINLAKDLDFKTEVQYFDYIIESQINGQPQQVKELYNAMKPVDKQAFKQWVKNDCAFCIADRVKTLTITIGIKIMNRETFLSILPNENKILINALENEFINNKNSQIYTDILNYQKLVEII